MQLFETGEPVVLSFATPIFQHCWPEAEITPVNAGLKAAILARRACTPGTQISNIGGWQSTHDLMSWEVPELKQLGAWINQAFGAVMSRELGTKAFQYRYGVNAWANVNEGGDYNRTHTHPNNHWSGVYYVDTGRPDPNIVPNDARVHRPAARRRRLRISGDLPARDLDAPAGIRDHADVSELAAARRVALFRRRAAHFHRLQPLRERTFASEAARRALKKHCPIALLGRAARLAQSDELVQ